jgi:K+-transporting ATPase ATPase B chain
MANQTSLFTGPLMAAAARDSFVKLDPRTLIRNPVMFVTGIVAALSTMLLVKGILTGGAAIAFQSQLAFWLWLTVLFGNFAEAMAEGRGKAQAASLRSTKADLIGKLLVGVGDVFENTPAHQLEVGDVVLVETGDLIPADGEVIAGVASVNEAAITGESAPVIREAGGDRSAVTAGTRVIADSIRVRVTAAQGQGFLDRMIALVEGASRQKTPNEIALTILLAGLTLIFLIAVGTLPAFAAYAGGAIAVPVLVALFVTLIPTTISALLSAIGIAGMDRLVRFNVLAKSGRAVEAAGDIDTLLLDKTGTITIGDRQATAFLPIPGVSDRDLIAAARLASLSDETPEGRSIVVLAGDGEAMPAGAEPIKFTSQTRVSGLQIGDRSLVKGAVDAVLRL